MFFFFFYYSRSCKCFVFFFSSRRRHTRWPRDWSSDVCSSDLTQMRDFLALGLRTREGIDPARFERRFGVSLCEVLGATLTELVEENCLEWHAGRLRVVESRILVTNEVMLRLSPLSAPRRGGGGVILGDPGAQPPAQVE